MRRKEIFIRDGRCIVIDLSPPDQPDTVTVDLDEEDVNRIIDRAFRLGWGLNPE